MSNATIITYYKKHNVSNFKRNFFQAASFFHLIQVIQVIQEWFIVFLFLMLYIHFFKLH